MTRPPSPAPARPVPPRQPHPLLLNFLNICQTQSIADFLFIQTPNHLTPLTDPNLSDTAYLFDATITRSKHPTLHPNPNQPASTPNDSHRIHSRFLLVPAHRARHVTVGVGVAEAFSILPLPNTSQLVTRSMLLNLRFMFDAFTHTFLVVIDSPEQDLFLIFYAHNPSPTTCTAISGRIRRSAFLDIIKPNPTALTLQAILPCFVYLIGDSLFRPCIVCNAPFSQQCSCTFPVVPPHHFRQAMQQVHGYFSGVASNLHPPSATPSKSVIPQIPLDVSHEYKRHLPWHLMQNLRYWALSKAPVTDPRDSIQLSQYGNEFHYIHDPNLERNATLARMTLNDLDVCSPDADAILAELLAMLAEPMMGSDSGSVAAEWYRLLLGTEGEHGGATETVESLNRCWERQECEPPPHADICMSRGTWGQDGEYRQVSDELHVLPEREPPPASGATVMARPGPRSVNQGNCRSEGVEGAQRCAELRAETKAGAKEDVGSIVKRMKAEERRIRNRESAHRSNQRKRAVMALLEKEVWRARRRAYELQVRENKLQEENRLLRKRIEKS